jgi:hypothetical protein
MTYLRHEPVISLRHEAASFHCEDFMKRCAGSSRWYRYCPVQSANHGNAHRDRVARTS